MNLPLGLPLELMQQKWRSILNPFIANPSLSTQIIESQALVSGSNTINHQLGRALVGWRIVRQRAKAQIYDTQDSNPNPSLTLLLTADGSVTVDIEVF